MARHCFSHERGKNKPNGKNKSLAAAPAKKRQPIDCNRNDAVLSPATREQAIASVTAKKRLPPASNDLQIIVQTAFFFTSGRLCLTFYLNFKYIEKKP